ncbi:MAG: DUF2164 domain-containing protein [Methanomassiliicoccus sp.]|nr:DUF2164 domain-containing protein [Methanomassiliicoccus sp.]
MRKVHKITIEKEERERLVSKIKSYFLNVREEEIGDLAAGLLLDFIIDELAPTFYNQGVRDSYSFMNERVEDLLNIEK